MCGAFFSGLLALSAAAFLDVAGFLADRQHRFAEAVELGLGLRFRRLDHQRAGNRPAHGRRMEAAVDQALGDVVDRDAGAVDQRAGVDDALMRDAAGLPTCRARHRRPSSRAAM